MPYGIGTKATNITLWLVSSLACYKPEKCLAVLQKKRTNKLTNWRYKYIFCYKRECISSICTHVAALVLAKALKQIDGQSVWKALVGCLSIVALCAGRDAPWEEVNRKVSTLTIVVKWMSRLFTF